MKTTIKLNDLEFDALTAGKKDDELVIFLHGFPETSFMWRDLIVEVASNGFYCVAPNLRGYSKNASPIGKRHYSLDKIVDDIVGIANSFKKKKFHLVGHDWGALVGWYTVADHSNRILSWSALSVPHPSAFAKAINIDVDQKKKSGYIKLFMIPFIPEYKIRKNDFKLFRKVWKYSSPEEVEEYLKVFRNKRSLSGALNYYRANFGKNRPQPIGKIHTPTLYLWGKKERYIGETAAELNSEYMSGKYEYKILDGGHWLIQTNYEEVKNAIIDHLQYK